MVENEGFRIGAPTLTTEVKQGELQIVTVSLKRDSLFKQDVTLHIKAANGISVDPVKGYDQSQREAGCAGSDRGAQGCSL